VGREGFGPSTFRSLHAQLISFALSPKLGAESNALSGFRNQAELPARAPVFRLKPHFKSSATRFSALPRLEERCLEPAHQLS